MATKRDSLDVQYDSKFVKLIALLNILSVESFFVYFLSINYGTVDGNYWNMCNCCLGLARLPVKSSLT